MDEGWSEIILQVANDLISDADGVSLNWPLILARIRRQGAELAGIRVGEDSS